MSRVAVIGAGWAGLSAAVCLAERGIPVTVFEAARTLGGRARRVTRDGIELDNGQHILLGAYRTTVALMRKVGAEETDALLRMRLELRFADGFRLRAPGLPYPLNLLAALLGARRLSAAQRASAVGFMAYLHRSGFQLPADCSVAALLDARGQFGALRRYCWEPLCISALNTPPERASAQVFVRVLRDGLTGARGSSDLLLPRKDLGRIFPEPASKFVFSRGGSIESGRAVRSIRRVGPDLLLDDDPRHYSHVIVACAPYAAAPLLHGFPELASVRQSIESLRYEPIYTCYLNYPEDVRLPCPMLGLDGPLGQWAFDRGQLSARKGLLAVVISATGAHQELTQQMLARSVHEELTRTVPDLPEPLWTRVIGEKRATFSCGPGITRPGTRTGIDGLYLAGDYTQSDYPATLEAAARSGVSAAACVH